MRGEVDCDISSGMHDDSALEGKILSSVIGSVRIPKRLGEMVRLWIAWRINGTLGSLYSRLLTSSL